MTISLVGSDSFQQFGTNKPTVSVPLPAGCQAGDLAELGWFTGTETPGAPTTPLDANPPSGWNAVSALHQVTSVIGSEGWWKILTAADISTGSVGITSTVGTTTGYKRELFITVLRGAAHGAAASSVGGAAQTTRPCPAVTAVSASAWVINRAMDRASPPSSAFTLPGNLVQSQVQIGAGSGSPSSVAAYDDLVGSGSVGGNTITGNVSTGNWITHTVVVEPAAAGNNPPTCTAAASASSAEPYSTQTLNGTSSDGDGTVVSGVWSQIAGTAADWISGQSTASATVKLKGTIAGETNTFRYTVTDNGGATAHADVNIATYPAAIRAARGGVFVPVELRRYTT